VGAVPSAPLIGRDDLVARLRGWVADAAAGRGRAVLVEGEPGIGKSALVRDACTAASKRGCQVFWGSATS
jgi:predicted ATPase